jgi:hypothetical protein
MVALAMFILIVALFVGLGIIFVKLVAGIARTGSSREFAQKHLAENDHESEKNKAILGIALVCLWASFYLIAVAPYVGWALFAISTYVFIKALCLCSLNQWALKEVNGEYEVDNAFNVA